MLKGYLALVLHAHLPYIRHPEKENFLEEKWFFEALTETYIPLIGIFDNLLKDGVDFRVTVSLSPPLISMMADDLLRKRYLMHLNKLIELAYRETERTAGTEFASTAWMYLERFDKIRDIFVNRYGTNLLQAFRKYREKGCVELITSCATHGFLPLMKKKESIRAQVAVAADLFTRQFGTSPRGIWLPECAYTPGIDEILKNYGIQFFFTDTHGIMYATPCPVQGIYAPLYTPAGVAAFGRDPETSRQVWDMHQGYPGDYWYREFYRDIGYDLGIDYIGPYVGENNLRIDTGIKYYRITGKTDHKEVYNRAVALERAAEHAGNFVFNREQQVEHLASRMDRLPLVVSTYDAELFGHWWYEGPEWINFMLRKLHYDQDTVKTITPWEYLNLCPTNQVASLPMSSWGHKGYNEVWLSPPNDWIYKHLHKAETRMSETAQANPAAEGLRKRALNQMARELLLAQSSDWAFIMKMKTAVGYAEKRTKDHIARFSRLYWAVNNNDLHEDEISLLEKVDNIFPDIDYRVYQPDKPIVVSFSRRDLGTVLKSNKVLMLSWEFPPKTVGGLARHVHDLSKALVAQGQDIHVITCYQPGSPNYEMVNGVHVYRVEPGQCDTGDFLKWVDSLNIAMAERAQQLIREYSFDLIHAHDWLVFSAAKDLKERYRLPLVSTIHATEYGRNRGIHNDIQRYINQIEWELTYESWEVICCSSYMAQELSQVFQLPAEKIRVIANGVEIKNIQPKAVDLGFRKKYAAPYEKMVYFIGRLVPEKGVQVLINAVPTILRKFPDTKFVISGSGPYQDYLEDLTERLGVKEKVYFTGFANDETRNLLFAGSDIAVFPSLYEPFGIVALEAMATRVPVIVSDTGGMAKLIEHGVDGLKVLPGDAAGLAEAISSLLDDPGLAHRLSQAAWDKVNSAYNWGVIAGETISVYNKIISEAKKVGYAVS
ncbi:1,4-alpha-glucan branching protein domain-containing protein [Phosphitispora sp. TUW77]|uniref:1,4-alpha-glucan branching protein domain-containing protein n=1 Tax=Phosphitispora sp. TUW77 TaxID=3152361 RepID=UPI003AB71915